MVRKHAHTEDGLIYFEDSPNPDIEYCDQMYNKTECKFPCEWDIGGDYEKCIHPLNYDE